MLTTVVGPIRRDFPPDDDRSVCAHRFQIA
jgi:hypothetical protein